MATSDTLQQLDAIIEQFHSIDIDRLIRKSLGEASLATEFGSRDRGIRRIIDLAKDYAVFAHDDV